MRFKYNVRELKDTDNGDMADVGTVEEMEAMSFKKLRAKLDHKKEYFVDMRKDGYSELRSMSRHSERYAEDCAENFVMGWGEFTDEYILSRQES